MLRTIDSSLYVRISFLIIDETEKIWKLELGEYEANTFVPLDAFYGAAEWQGSQGGCYWWTFAETHIQNAISYREDPSTLYLPPGYDIFYPSYEGILSDDGKVELYPVVR